MKQLPITSPSYKYIIQGFKEWLQALGYAECSVYNMPNYIREFLHYQEQSGKTQITEINNRSIKAYYRELKARGNTRRGGGLSNNYLNKHLQALQKFSDYLRQSGRLSIPKLYIPSEENNHEIKDIPTQKEITKLFEVTTVYPEPTQGASPRMFEALALRDRAMLTVFYGCGLRRNEAVHLDVSDIQANKQYIHVRKGKNYKERLVPVNNAGLACLQDYLYEGRPHFLRSSKQEAFFISQGGRRASGQTLLLRLKTLIRRTEDAELQQKEIGLHTLRHSIATHLLQNGMELEAIAKFLGHTSLESTQIYTHLMERENELSGGSLLRAL